jgi:hypothetical protein
MLQNPRESTGFVRRRERVCPEGGQAAHQKEDTMAHYIISGDRIAAVASPPVKPAKDALIIGSAAEIAASDLPAAKLVALWNALPGITPITKFKDRQTAVKRLWAAFEKIPVSGANKPTRIGKARAHTKQAQVIAMLQRAGGATVEEIATTTKWQAHTVRGMISGALKKKLALDVVSSNEKRGRVYRMVTVVKRAA